jgi:hypothetical protein
VANPNNHRNAATITKPRLLIGLSGYSLSKLLGPKPGGTRKPGNGPASRTPHVCTISMGKKPPEPVPAFTSAMQRLWDIGSIDATGRADTELRRPHHLIAKGKAPVTEADVIALGQMPDAQLRLVLPWIAHRLSLAEAMDRLFKGELAPPFIAEEI